MLSVQQAGISLRISLDNHRLEQIVSRARVLELAAQQVQRIPVFEEYYEGPEPISAEGLLKYLPRLLEEEYQLLYNAKVQQIRSHLATERAKQAQSFQLARQIESAQKLANLATRKNDLIERHVALDVRIESERHRLEMCQQQAKMAKSSRQLVLSNQLAEVGRELEKDLRQASDEVQKLADSAGRELESHMRTVAFVKRLEADRKVPHLTKSQDTHKQQRAAIWQQYQHQASKLEDKFRTEIEAEQQFVKELLAEHTKDTTLQEMDFRNTVKELAQVPSPTSQQEMQRCLHRIDHLKRKLQRLSKLPEEAAEYKRTKKQLKRLVGQFEYMIESRQRLKRTLRL